MISALGQSLPIALGVLVSPMPIVALVLMLVSERARSNGFSFVLGWLVGIFLVGLVVVLLAGAVSGESKDTPAWADWLKIVLGLLMLFLAVRSWRGRPAPGTTAPSPKWMVTIDEFTPVKAAGLGALFGAVNPKNLLLVVSGATTIAAATSSFGNRIVALVVFTVVASLGVIITLGVYLGAGAKGVDILGRVKELMIANNALIMAVLLLVLGAKLVGDGVSGL